MKKMVMVIFLFMLVIWGLAAAGSGPVKADVLSALKFRAIGPALMSGRIADIAVHPTDRSVWYIAAGSGGVWKTVNAGTTWRPVFDSQPSYSIGCITIDPGNPDTIWVGTGENVSGRHVGFGDGVYRSLNGGLTWTGMGLERSEHISKILVDPRDSGRIYLAAEGPLWSPGGERGLYISEDHGKTWLHSLNISADTGVTDIALAPGNPEIIYAAAYQRRRSVAAFLAGGPESGIYKSSDGGQSWRKLTVGLPRGQQGRIGLAVSPADPAVVYATIEASAGERGFYLSCNRGESWRKMNGYTSGGTGPHYYQEIFADPTRAERVYQMDVWMHVTENSGRSFSRVPEKSKHSDNHALYIFAENPEHLLLGSDGGLYETFDRGNSWNYFANLPLTQFYKLALDNSRPFYTIHGGTQDNASQAGPSATLNQNGILTSDWFTTSGADGYACAFDPDNPDIIYAEWQNGSLNRYDKKSGELVDIKPQPGKDAEPLRWNWDAPLIISPHSGTRLYFAAQKVFRSDNRGDSWTCISADLTRNIFRYEEKIMGKTWSIDSLWDHGAMSMYSTITSISESPLAEDLLYAGTDDGLIQVSEDGGGSWRRVEKIPAVPGRYFVNEIRASRHDKDTVYAALDNHKTGDLKPYLVMSRNRGRSWTSITGDLPARNIVWCLTQDHVLEDLLFIGTEFGIYFTPDSGGNWTRLSSGVPTISFRDIEIHEGENDLVGASFGRGFYVLDDYSPLRELEQISAGSHLFPVADALMYIQRRPINLKDNAFLGDRIFRGPNPPFGAVFTVYLKEGLQTNKQKRQRAEKEREKAGKVVAFPGWDALRREEMEESPALVLTVRDRDGQVVRRLTAPASTGMQRLVWDLRYPSVDPVELETPTDLPPWADLPVGPLVVPGDFTVSLAKMVDGKLTPLAEPRPFTVKSLGLATLGETDRGALLAYQKKAGELQRAMMGAGAAASDALRRLQYIRKALLKTPKADMALLSVARKLGIRLNEMMKELYGDRTIGSRSEATAPALAFRIGGQLSSTCPITDTQKRNYDIAADGFVDLLDRLRQAVEVDLKKLERELEAAGAPWTPGRSIPVWIKK